MDITQLDIHLFSRKNQTVISGNSITINSDVVLTFSCVNTYMVSDDPELASTWLTKLVETLKDETIIVQSSNTSLVIELSDDSKYIHLLNSNNQILFRIEVKSGSIFGVYATGIWYNTTFTFSEFCQLLLNCSYKETAGCVIDNQVHKLDIKKFGDLKLCKL